jgi:8-oxo-dGTP pyrophosphatase MutT (NUDIX family)
MKQVTLCIPVKGNKILLGMKKKGFGEGNYNGFGGKLEQNEEIEEAVIRELREEVGLITTHNELKKAGEVTFFFPTVPEDKNWNQTVHIFFIEKWTGNPEETEEMKPEWFERDKIPYNKMWESDQHWMPLILNGKYVTATFTYNEKKELINKEIQLREK